MKHIILFFLVFMSLNTIVYSQGKIEKAEESLTKQVEISSDTSESIRKNNTNNNNSDGNFFMDVFGNLFVQAFLYSAYSVAIESPFEMEHKGSSAFLTKYPYKNSDKGNFSYEWEADTEIFTTAITNRFVFENKKVYGNHLNVDMRFLKRLGLELNYLQLWEESNNFGNNALAIYTALAKYRRVRTERFDGYWGLGAAYVDGEVNKLGFTYGLGAEWFFVNPLSLEANFNQTLINDNTVNKFNALLNYHRKQYKFTGGYEHLKIGSVGFSTVSAGIGVSF